MIYISKCYIKLFRRKDLNKYCFEANDNDFNIDENTTFISDTPIKTNSEFYLTRGYGRLYYIYTFYLNHPLIREVDLSVDWQTKYGI